MRMIAPISICIAVLLSCMAPVAVRAQTDSDPALVAIVKHPKVAARMKASPARLAWLAAPADNGRACYKLAENQPTHIVTIAHYCFDRRTATVLEYDVATDSYIEPR